MDLDRINHHLMRMQFGGMARIEIYETVSQLLENRVLLIDALRALYNIKSDGGRKKSDPSAYVLARCIDAVSGGHPLSSALGDFIPAQESSLLAAGEKSGQLSKAFEDATRVILAKRRMMSAVVSAATYPVLLFGLASYLLNMVATDLVPKLAKITDPNNWEGAAYVLYLMGTAIDRYGLFFLLSVLTMIVLVTISMPYLRGRLRVYLDRFPPWSLYRTVNGATFLLNLAVLLRAGVKLQDGLQLMRRQTTPWMAERIDGALYGTSMGVNLGEALKNSDLEFPDRQAIHMIALLANTDGFEQSLSRFGDRWLDQSIKTVERVAKAFMSAGILVIGALMILVISGASGIQDAIQSSIR